MTEDLLKGGDQLMKVTIQGSPKEVSELIKNISSAGDRQDVKKIISKQLNDTFTQANEKMFENLKNKDWSSI